MRVIYLWMENGEPVYVGKAVNWEQRLSHYNGVLRGTRKPVKIKNGYKLNEAKMKSHPERFTYKIIEIQNENCSDDMLNKAEKFWIKYYNTWIELNPDGYNLTPGGDGFTSEYWTEEKRSE